MVSQSIKWLNCEHPFSIRGTKIIPHNVLLELPKDSRLKFSFPPKDTLSSYRKYFCLRLFLTILIRYFILHEHISILFLSNRLSAHSSRVEERVDRPVIEKLQRNSFEAREYEQYQQISVRIKERRIVEVHA